MITYRKLSLSIAEQRFILTVYLTVLPRLAWAVQERTATSDHPDDVFSTVEIVCKRKKYDEEDSECGDGFFGVWISMMLADTAPKQRKPKNKPYKVVDRDGMYAHVAKSGTM